MAATFELVDVELSGLVVFELDVLVVTVIPVGSLEPGEYCQFRTYAQ